MPNIFLSCIISLQSSVEQSSLKYYLSASMESLLMMEAIWLVSSKWRPNVIEESPLILTATLPCWGLAT